MKFKVGQKVRLLPSAVYDGVSHEAIGNIGRIIIIDDRYNCCVSMDNAKLNNGDYGWAVSLKNIAPAVVVGEQLLLWDDIWDKE